MRPKKRNPVELPKPQRTGKALKPWEKQELDGARIMKGERTPGSGGGARKGDVRNRFAVSEMKTTGKNSFRVKMETLCKLCREAGNQVPVFVFGFDEMPKTFSSDWFALPASKFDVVVSVLDAVAEGNMEEAQRWLKCL